MAATLVDTVHTPPSDMAQPSTPDASSASVASSPTAVLPGDSNDPQAPPKSLGDALSSMAAGKKKRRRKKKGLLALESSLDGLDAELVEAEKQIGTNDDIGSWRARAGLRLDRLRGVAGELDTLRRELKDAVDRADDAQNAERMVNAGLRSAHTLLAERDKALASSTSHAATLTAEVSTLTDEKRKIEKRLALLKTVSEKLQEAREARDTAERRADDVAAANSELKKAVAELELNLQGQADTVSALKEDIERHVAEHRVAVEDAALAQVEAEKKIQIAAGAGAVAGVLASVVLGGLIRASRRDREE